MCPPPLASRTFFMFFRMLVCFISVVLIKNRLDDLRPSLVALGNHIVDGDEKAESRPINPNEPQLRSTAGRESGRRNEPIP
jgi:hypothetical protein